MKVDINRAFTGEVMSELDHGVIEGSRLWELGRRSVSHFAQLPHHGSFSTKTDC